MKDEQLKAGVNDDPMPIHIARDALYRPTQIELMLGVRCLNHLRGAGLRAVAGWYLGDSILECFRRVWQEKSSQRVAAGKEVEDAEHAGETEEVEENCSETKIQPVPKQRRSSALRSQLEEIERDIREEAV